MAAALVPVLALLCLAGFARAATVTYTGTSSDNDWSDSQNWTPPPYPNSAGDDVAIDTVTVTLDVPVTIGSLTLSNGAAVEMLHDTALNVTGNLTDNGSIVVDSDDGSGAAALNFNGGTVSGTGGIILTTPGYSELTGTLTQAAGHTISGAGEITGALTNNGVVNANVTNQQTLTLEDGNVTNNGVIEATGYGQLDINGITVTQGTSAQLLASGGNVAFLGNTKVIGGSLNGSTGFGYFSVNSGTTTFNSVSINRYLSLSESTGAIFNSLPSLNTEVDLAGGSTLNVTGNLIDNGLITVNVDAMTIPTVANFNGVAVSGTGDINMYNAGAEITGTLTQGAGHTIDGTGEIAAKFTNNGVVNADGVFGANGPTFTLSFQTFNIVNNQLIEATDSNGTLTLPDAAGLVDIIGIAVTQGTNGRLFADGGNVQFDGNTTVNGGALSASGTSAIVINTGTANFNAVTNNASVDMASGTKLIVGGGLINNGTVNMAEGTTVKIVGNLTGNGSIFGLGGDNAIPFGGGTVSGTGSIVLYGTVLSGTLIQAAGHTISGYGTITAALTNEGLVNASATGRSLVFSGANIVNNQTIECTGGVIEINGITVTQGTGGELLAGTGHVQLDASPTIAGGVLYSSGTGSPFIVSTGTATLKSVTSNAEVSLQAGTTLNVIGNLPGTGSITVNSGGTSSPTVVNFEGGTVSGTGVILLNAANAYAQVTGTLTQGAGHTIRGYGEIEAALTNAGLVNATVPGETLTLAGGAMTNDNTLQAGGGLLDISGITVHQAPDGQLLAAGGNVQFDGATTISGGVLNSASAGSVFVVHSGGANFNALTNNATVNLVAGTTLGITGTLADNGRIVVDSGGTGALTALHFNGGSVTGSGAIILNAANAELTGTLTQTASHGISGLGAIDAAFTNNGTVDANVGGQTLSVSGPTTNRGVMEASGGGTLSFSSGVLANLSGATLSAGSYEAFAGSTISLPGSITTNAATVILSGTGSTFSAINGLAMNDGVFEVEAGRSFTAGSALVNAGGIVAAGGMLAINGGLTQDAAGSLSISGSGSASDTSAAIGGGGAGNAMVTVSGSGSKWTNTGNLNLGSSGTGTLTITGGALVSVTGTTTIGSAGTLEFDGNSSFSTGSLASQGGALLTLGATTFAHAATLGAGGVSVNTNGFNSTFSGAFSGVGGLAKSGTGALALTGSSSYTGATSVKAGSLALTTGAARTSTLGNTAITVAAGATFTANVAASHFSSIIDAGMTGSGSAGATLTLSPGSALNMAGSAIATFNLRQESGFTGPAFTIGGASGAAPTLTFDIGNAATGPDLIDVTRTVTVLATGAKLTIAALAGDTSLTSGSYDLITSAGGFSGTGGNGFTLTDTTLAISGTTYDFSLAHSSADDEVLTVSVAPAMAPVLTNEPGEEAIAGGVAVPDANGNTAQAATAAVPEPGTDTSLLCLFAIAAGWMLRRRRGENGSPDYSAKESDSRN